MAEVFDSEEIAKRGWRQGAILGDSLAKIAAEHAPQTVDVDGADWLVLTSHDCDIVNVSIAKEPVVEVLRMRANAAGKVDRRQSWGRNPRALQLELEAREAPIVLSCGVHDRWTIPRTLLMRETPAQCLPDKERRLVAEWLDELPADAPYKCDLILAVPLLKRSAADWASKRAEIEEEVGAFWNQFETGIECVGVEILGTDEITLADIEPYQRFDADWVSFEDETSTTPPILDMVS